MNDKKKPKWNWKKLQKGRGIKASLPDDLDKNSRLKNRPGIIIKAYPKHIKIQFMSTQPSKYDAFSVKINNKIQYIRPIYFQTIMINDLKAMWKDEDGKVIKIDKKSNFFQKVSEMQSKEILEIEETLDLSQDNNIDQLIQIKNQALEIETLKLEIQTLEGNQRILESENELIKSQLENQKSLEKEKE